MKKVKTIMENCEWKISGTHLRCGFVSITEATANVPSITELTRESFAKSNLILIQSNCLKYQDSEGRKGK